MSFLLQVVEDVTLNLQVLQIEDIDNEAVTISVSGKIN
jgi:hypothetical protein